MNYQQLIGFQRHQMESYLKTGFNQSKIAEALGVNKSTIIRELNRTGQKRSYNATFATTASTELIKEAYKYHIFDCNMNR